MSINKSELRQVIEKAKRFDYYKCIYIQSNTSRTISCNSTKLQKLPIVYENDLMNEIIQKYMIKKNANQTT